MTACQLNTTTIGNSIPRRLMMACTVVTLAGSLGQPTSAAEIEGESDEALKQEILDAMQRRAEFGESFVFEWKESLIPAFEEQLKQALDDLANAPDPEGKAQALRKARSMMVTHRCGDYRLIVDGTKLRIEQRGRVPAKTDLTKPLPKRIVFAIDDQIGARLVQIPGYSYSFSFIEHANTARTHVMYGYDDVLVPIRVALRGPSWLGQSTATARWSTLEERPIAVLRVEKGRRTYALWCDPEKDYHAVRIEARKDDRGASLLGRCDISYGRHGRTDQWAPLKWRSTWRSEDGAILRERQGEVTRYEIGTAIPAEEFRIVKFPVGTFVKDIVSGEQYIVLEGDVIRIVTEEEQRAGLTYEELLAPLHVAPGDGEREEEP